MLAYPYGIYQYIFLVVFFIHPTHIYIGIYYEFYHCAFMGVLLYLTSLIYWINPLLNSNRRIIDIIVAKLSITYHVYLSLYSKNKIYTTFPMLFGISLYYFSFYLCKINFIKTAAFSHAMLHIIISISASITYIDLKKIDN